MNTTEPLSTTTTMSANLLSTSTNPSVNPGLQALLTTTPLTTNHVADISTSAATLSKFLVTTITPNISNNVVTIQADDPINEGMRDNVLGVTLLVINILIVVLNVFTIMVILRFRTRNIIDLFVLALASTDLVKGLIPVPMSIIVYLSDWYLVESK